MIEREFRDYLPFLAVNDGIVLSKRGDITFGWELTLPTAFTVNEAGYDGIINSFLQAYRLLPPYCVVHKQDVYCFDVFHAEPCGHFLSDSYQKHFNGRKYLNGHSFMYVTFSSKSILEKKNSDSGFLGMSSYKTVSEDRVRECAAIASQFEAVLSNNPLLGIRRMRTEDFIRVSADGSDAGVISDYLSLYRSAGPDFNMEFYPDHVRYGDEEARIWYVEDSDAYQAMVSSISPVPGMSVGQAVVVLSGGSPIGYNLRIPHVVNRYILTVPANTLENELDARRRTMSSFSFYSAKDSVNADEIAAYLLASAKNSATTAKCHMNVMAWGHPSKMSDFRNAIVTAFQANLKVSVVEETRVAPLLHYAAIPGAAAELGMDNYMTSELTSFCCHGLWDGYDLGMRKGVVRVCDRETLTPISIDIQQEARNRGFINGMNAIVIGPTGSGKSFTMNSLVQNFYEAGQHIFIIDVGDSYQGLSQVIAEESGGKDGVYNTYDPEHPYGFNPFRSFRHWNDTDEEGEKVNSGYDFFLSLLKTIYKPEGGWNKESSSVLKFLVVQFLEWWEKGAPEGIAEDLLDAHMNERRRRAERNKRKMDEEKARLGFVNPIELIFSEKRREADPLFDDFFQYVTLIVIPLMRDENFKMGNILISQKILDAERFGAAMDIYKKDGIYGFLLNAEDEPDLFASRLTVFEVDKIKDNMDVLPIWVLLIMHSFEDKMRSLPCQKVMVIEEAWKAIATDTMAEFIVWMWRTARKFSTSAIVVTQDIMDLTGSAIVKDAIIVNSDVRILLDQRGNVANFEKGASVLGLSDMAKNLVLSVNANLNPDYKYKEGFFAIGPNYCNVFAIEVSPEQACAFESNKDFKRDLMALKQKTGSLIGAIRQIVDNKNKQ